MTFSGFFEFFGDLEWLAIVVGTVALMVFGFLWYGPLFGKAWAARTGAGMQSGDPARMILTAVYLLVFNIGLQYLGLVVADFDAEHALVAGVVLGVLAIGPALYSGVVWAKKHTTVFLIDGLFWILATAVAVAVQSLVV